MYGAAVLLLVTCHIFTTVSGGEVTHSDYEEYRGCVNVGHNGEECANWLRANNWGDDQFIAKDKAPQNGIGDHDYCRNPGGQRSGLWCYNKNRIKEKVYCPMNKCVIDPKDDPKCPDSVKTAPHKSSASTPKEFALKPQPRPSPDVTITYAMIGDTLTLQCSSKFSDGLWQTGPGLEKPSTNNLVISPVKEESGGDWKCSSRGRKYITRVIVCHMIWSECELVGGWRIRSGNNSCSGELIKEVCDPGKVGDYLKKEHSKQDEPRNGTGSGNLRRGNPAMVKLAEDEARQQLGTESTLSSVGFCEKHAVVCGVAQGYLIGFLFMTIMFIAVFYVKRSRQRRSRTILSEVNGRANYAMVTLQSSSPS